MKKFVCILALAILLTFSGLIRFALALSLTSLTVEGVTNTGSWLNAPGGIWSTNLADPLAQLGVSQNGVFLNKPGNGLDLGEISIELQPGINTFDLYGTSPRGGFYYYGVDLFFDHIATPPQMAVYNSNGSTGIFSITPAGTTIAGSANGGLFPDVAPGMAFYSAPDGSTVEVIAFTANFSPSNPDLITWGNIGSDGYPDVIAHLTLKYNPANQPPIAICKDVTVTAGADCQAYVSVDDGSYDPDDDPITIIQDPPGPYSLGSTIVTLIVTDDNEASDSCTATVTVEGTPGTEVCDGKDNDCDGAIDEGLGETTCGVGECRATVQNCVAGRPQTCTAGTPGIEVCDGKDNDCDGAVDEGLGQTTCGVGECRATVQNCVAGMPQTCIAGTPGTEVCDGKDNDCDGAVDEGACNAPPDCSKAFPTLTCLWPANHQWVPVSILGVTDPDGDPVSITITSITSDEPTASDKGSGGAKYAPGCFRCWYK